ncbi:ion transporter [Ferruginibacter sp. HRS2-29]|uniref:ion transporter n=1 Tax=Ferruginibacter sp. HRS2-29 TaxID=2487334 RepID=UPI0020CD518F|nr:ion transporter [Ferruginibacter sp. HRS2-29]MCP9751788.1 ion transporter [Ferruginibacter sp. HRS2-29]
MQQPPKTWRTKLYEVIFESDTVAGKIFDICLLLLITASIVVICLESVESLYAKYWHLFVVIELMFTVIFTIEYILRLIAVPRPMGYIKSFYGVIDLLAIVPTYLAIIFPSLHFLLVIRALRLLRVFRIFKMVHFLNESLFLVNALWAARRKILVFFFSVILITVIAGSFMFVIEHNVNKSFNSIPQSVYWAIVTLTTVGYGDISPITPLGKVLASFIMLLGYCIIAVPTGILSASIANEMRKEKLTTQTCPVCLKQGHETDAKFCKFCGAHL